MRNFKYPFSLLILFTILTVSNTSFAQVRKSFQRYSTVGIGAGTSHYIGDLAPYSTFYKSIYSNVRYNVGINYETYLSPNFSARLSATHIRLFGNDATYGGTNDFGKGTNKLRNLHFRNDMVEFSAMGIYNFVPFSDRKRGKQFSPFIGAGIALLSHTPKAKGSIQDKTNFSLKPNEDGKYLTQKYEALKPMHNNLFEDGRVASYGSIAFAIPVTVGVKARLNQKLTLGLEANYRLALTNYLDDVGNAGYNFASEISYRADEDYNPITAIPRDQIFRDAATAAGHIVTDGYFPSSGSNLVYPKTNKRGTNSLGLDSYITTQISLSYNISNKVKCPPIR